MDSQSTKKLAFSNSILRIWDQLVASHWDKGNALKINETQGCLTLGHSNCNLSIFQTDFVTIFFKFSLCGLPFLITAGQGRKMGKRESSKKWMSLLRWFCHNFPPIFYPSYWGLQEINPNSQSSVKLPLFSVFSFTEKQNRWQFHGTLSFNLWHLQYSFLAYINLLLTPASWVWSLTDVSKSASIQKWHIGAPIFSGSLVNWTGVTSWCQPLPDAVQGAQTGGQRTWPSRNLKTDIVSKIWFHRGWKEATLLIWDLLYTL